MRSRFVLWLAATLTASAVVVGFVFAGSAGRLADGTKIAGIDVGGLTPQQATALLRSKEAGADKVPGTFTAGGKTFHLPAALLSVHSDWAAAVAQAQNRGGGFGVVRGYRRLALELFPSNIAPQVESYDGAVGYEVRQIAKAVDRPERDASLVRHGLHISIAPGAAGFRLDRAAAGRVIVKTLSSFSRSTVALPTRRATPNVTVARLLTVQRLAARVVSAPVQLRLGDTTWRVPRWRLATLLRLPAGGYARLAIAGPAADRYFSQLRKRIDKPGHDATWRPVAGGSVRLIASTTGVALDLETSAQRLLAAAERTTNRVAELSVVDSPPQRSTAQARAMGIVGTVGSYETIYGGEANRIHNVQLVARLIDGKVIAPHATFSFNEATGERSAAKGFLVAPVIINGEVATGLGGGVCQVSTTVFNAAYEAGLPITARTNHALYISHYPLGRDATVDYPDVDLKFVNDTDHWLLLRTFVGSDSLSVVLYGTPQHRRVETIAAPLTSYGKLSVKKTVDATLKPGEVKVDDPGMLAAKTQVERKVYAANGALLSDQTWYSSYRALPKLERVGPKLKKKKPKVPAVTTTAPASA
jgi:vancomycin resistance protein YoaR